MLDLGMSPEFRIPLLRSALVFNLAPPLCPCTRLQIIDVISALSYPSSGSIRLTSFQ